MPSQHYRVTVAEIDRDDRMLVLGLLRQLTALHTEQLTLALAGGRIGDPLDLCKRLEAIAAASRAQFRRLNDARIGRRGRWSRELPDDPRLPVALRPFTRNGPHVGAYPDLRALARDVLGHKTARPDLEPYIDLDGLAIDLHLQGILWTLEHNGKIHAFRCPRDDDRSADHGPTPPADAAPLAAGETGKKRRQPRRPRSRK
ncbi:MAG TPA: hypothetical protein VIK91_26100 [Nannocystis sp.]